MREHVERSVIERKPIYDVGKLRWRKRNLIAPSDGVRLLARESGPSELYCQIARSPLREIPWRHRDWAHRNRHARARSDTGHIEIRHCRLFPKRTSSVNPDN